jgi:predicted DsbA family dithiol-disulfide isomerase
MYVDIVSDTVCPWCFIGKRRFERALALSGRNDIMVAWRPFQLNPDMPAEGMERQAYLAAKFGGGGRVQQIYGAIAETGKEEGIEFHFERIQRMPNTLASHRLVRLGAKQSVQDAVVENLFRAYFVEGRDVGDAEVLIDIAVQSGIEREAAAGYMQSAEDKDEIVSSDLYARRLGINGVPCFIVNRRYAVSGAQPPEAFQQVFELAAQDELAQPEGANPPQGAPAPSGA